MTMLWLLFLTILPLVSSYLPSFDTDNCSKDGYICFAVGGLFMDEPFKSHIDNSDPEGCMAKKIEVWSENCRYFVLGKLVDNPDPDKVRILWSIYLNPRKVAKMRFKAGPRNDQTKSIDKVPIMDITYKISTFEEPKIYASVKMDQKIRDMNHEDGFKPVGALPGHEGRLAVFYESKGRITYRLNSTCADIVDVDMVNNPFYLIFHIHDRRYPSADKEVNEKEINEFWVSPKLAFKKGNLLKDPVQLPDFDGYCPPIKKSNDPAQDPSVFRQAKSGSNILTLHSCVVLIAVMILQSTIEI